MTTSVRSALSLAILPASGFGMVELKGHDGLTAQVLPNAAIHAIRHEKTLVNQVLAGPAEDGLFRLLLRWRAKDGSNGWLPLVGPRCQFAKTGDNSGVWKSATKEGLVCSTTLQMHERCTGWSWHVDVTNSTPASLGFDVLLAQDLGLADEAAVRNNEAYDSQYIDLLPVHDDEFGWVVLARQNQAASGGKFPWLAQACASGAIAFCTDGTQFFGRDHRFTGEPAAARGKNLGSEKLQYEFAMACLQTGTREIPAGTSAEVLFLTRYLADHPAASRTADINLIRELRLVGTPPSCPNVPAQPRVLRDRASPSLFVTAPWQHGDAPAQSDWNTWFPRELRHEERDADGELLSFFHGTGTHVVSRSKESTVARPHGHVLRSGNSDWIDADQFGVTCYAAGIFAAQAYLGNPNIARLLSVVRNALNVVRASGQRVFVRRGKDEWRQLGIPSAFAIDPDQVRWIYKLGTTLLEAKVWCAKDSSASFLSLRSSGSERFEFLVTHQLALGDNEFSNPASATLHPEAGWIALTPDPDSLLGRTEPNLCFAIASGETETLSAVGGDSLILPMETEQGGPYATLRSKPCLVFEVALIGSHDGTSSLSDAVAAARAELSRSTRARTPVLPLQLRGADPGVSRVNEILPWFAHNASIHFAAPHGLEQYGGGAWGTRDVCQGSVEWLLASGDFATVRKILETVFEQQYAPAEDAALHAGSWPQWFMPEPYRFIQQTHSHGDVCFWPLKALCDYIEASNDIAFLKSRVGYTNPETFKPTGPAQEILGHCDQVIAHCESRFVAGTALVNYGDGDWDDTLQPADPDMRTRMISTWTVGLAYHAFRQFSEVCRRASETMRAAKLDALLARMRDDFARHAIIDGTVAGFLVHEPDGSFRPLIHPSDRTTGIRHRLLPMTRSMLAELFTAREAGRHASIIESQLRFADGVRLMSEPAVYHGGIETLFKRADTAANVGREIGLQYVHAHLRYAEAMAKLGDAEKLWQALQVVNPVGLAHVVPGAVARQSNVYFSSSDADFADRYEAVDRWSELRAGLVAVRGGWRLYSSGPGLFINKVRACLLGLRESFGEVVVDPVLPRSLDGLTVEAHLLGRPVTLIYSVKSGTSSPSAIRLNGTKIAAVTREQNPYRAGGLRIPGTALADLLQASQNRIEVDL